MCGAARIIAIQAATKFAPSRTEFLDRAFRLDRDGKAVPFNPNRGKVGDVVEALAAAAQLSDAVRAPTWLDVEQHCCPTDIFACGNGLLHLPTRMLLPHTPAYFSVNAVEYPYDPTAREPTAWLAFLSHYGREMLSS